MLVARVCNRGKCASWRPYMTVRDSGLGLHLNLACPRATWRLRPTQPRRGAHGAPTTVETEGKGLETEDKEARRLLWQQMEEECTKVTQIGCGVNIALAVTKFGAGVMGNSVALIADAAHSLSDLISDAITFAAIKMSLKPQDEDHPYGHGKYEALGALGISSILVGTGAGIGLHAWNSMHELLTRSAELAVEPPTAIALVAAGASILCKEWLYRITLKVADKYNSKVVNSNAWHHRSDAISSLVALGGVAGSMLTLPFLDSIAGLLVAGMIAKEGVKIGLDSAKDLTDCSLDDNVLLSIKQLLDKLENSGLGVSGFSHLRGRRMGPYMLVDVRVTVDPKMSASASHQACERVRLSILKAHPAIAEVMVHVKVDQPRKATKLRHLMRPQEKIERDVRTVLRNPAFTAIKGYTHFTCHYVDQKLMVQLEVVMDNELTVREARILGKVFKRHLVRSIKDLHGADIHLELSDDPLIFKQSEPEKEDSFIGPKPDPSWRGKFSSYISSGFLRNPLRPPPGL